MSDDELLEVFDGDEDQLVDDDLGAAMEGAGEDADEAEAEFDDDPFDDDDETTDDDPAASLDAVGDGDDEMLAEPVVDLAAIDGLEVDDDTDTVDVADDDDAVRPDEFVCRSCHMARKGSALADEDAMLCRDCV